MPPGPTPVPAGASSNPATVAPGVELADAGSATNRLAVRVQTADLEKTVLMKVMKSTATELPKSP